MDNTAAAAAVFAAATAGGAPQWRLQWQHLRFSTAMATAAVAVAGANVSVVSVGDVIVHSAVGSAVSVRIPNICHQL